MSVVHYIEKYRDHDDALPQARRAMLHTVGRLLELNPTAAVFAVLEPEKGLHAHVLIAAEEPTVVLPVSAHDAKRSDDVQDDTHAGNLGPYVLKRARSPLTYAEHLELNAGRLGYTSPEFWAGPWGDTFEDCNRARRDGLVFPVFNRAKRSAPRILIENAPQKIQSSDDTAREVLQKIRSEFGEIPRWTKANRARAANLLGVQPQSVRAKVDRARSRAASLPPQP